MHAQAHMQFPEAVQSAANNHPYPLLFATISGAHLYGFPSPDSDYDLRGVHIIPVQEVVGLESARETVEIAEDGPDIELDLVTHDMKKFFSLMLKKNGYVLEQLYSPLIVQTSSEHEELKEIGLKCITRNHVHHYLGFAETQWRLFEKEQPPRVKPLLYVYRVLLTGIHLMPTGLIEANLNNLNEKFRLPYIPELIEQKLNSSERHKLDDAQMSFHRQEYERLRTELDDAAQKSDLPIYPAHGHH